MVFMGIDQRLPLTGITDFRGEIDFRLWNFVSASVILFEGVYRKQEIKQLSAIRCRSLKYLLSLVYRSVHGSVRSPNISFHKMAITRYVALRLVEAMRLLGVISRGDFNLDATT